MKSKVLGLLAAWLVAVPVYASTVSFRLAETEALVILAELPPRGSYLSLQTYLFTRQAEIPTSDEIFLAYRRIFATYCSRGTEPGPAHHVGDPRRQQQQCGH